MSSDRRARQTGNRGDRGFTLPELLITVSVLGLIVAVLAAAIITTLRQTTSTEGRLNIARGEQTIDLWLPADLSSVDVSLADVAGTGEASVSTDAGASPCGAGPSGACDGIDMSGTNQLQLVWVDGGGTVTRIQYQYILAGSEYQLQRVKCVAGDCTMTVVLHDLDEGWSMSVTDPTDIPDLPLADTSRQISVTINGGGAGAGAGGGSNVISISAGGVQTGSIEPDDFNVPQFVRARTRCGGPVTLLLDDSGSINTAAAQQAVIAGGQAFVEAFRGTPTTVQVIKFSNKAIVFRPSGNTDWNYFWDMTDDAAVDALKATIASSMSFSSYTNWEDAFFRVAYEQDGSETTKPSSRVVFFTDGEPTRDRSAGSSYRSDSAGANVPIVDYGPAWPGESSRFHQESFDRAYEIVRHVQTYADVVAVGVGPAFTAKIDAGGSPGGNGEWIRANVNAPTAPSAPSAPAEPAPTGKQVISRLLKNLTDDIELANYSGGVYTNPDAAELYQLDDYAAFSTAMRAAALKDCGGTLSIQTRLGSTTGPNVDDEFVYENAEYRDPSGTPVDADPRTVTTSSQFRTGTFDFEIPAGTSYFHVDVTLQELETLTGFAPAATGVNGWTCRAGSTAKTPTALPIAGSSFSGITVDVRPNEAVSCILSVVPS